MRLKIVMQPSPEQSSPEQSFSTEGRETIMSRFALA